MLVIPFERLPQSPIERHSALRNYFCDKDAEVTRSRAGWELSLHWSGGTARYVDPRLDEGLAWWGEGVQRQTMPFARRRSGRILSVLFDTWTLHSWSEWLARTDTCRDDQIVILHVDDHRDLGAPRLFVEGRHWRDPIANAPCDLLQSETVKAAIGSGAIGMGSFLTPFLHNFPNSDVRHLCQPPKAPITRDFRIEFDFEPDTILQPEAVRPAVRLKTAEGTGPGRYRITPDPNAWLENIGPGPILLHIDMDYLNNRYDGDSDWRDRKDRLDPPLESVLARIDDMILALRKSGAAPRIQDIVIAYSPGFFPAEFWQAAAVRLCPALETLYDP
jgi:hypothetical protein